MEVDYDSEKSAINRDKHGISFEDAKALWDDDYMLEIPAKTLDEPRYLVIGKMQGRYWSAIVTYRGDTVRIISVRRARQEEVKLYESP